MKYLSILFTAILMVACVSNQKAQGELQSSSYTVEPASFSEQQKDDLSIATFAGGCFWCTEAVFEQVKGVKSVVSGYAGGEKPDPTYQEVAAGQTNYAESIQIYYDPEVVTYEELLEVFFGTHDPTQLNRQGPDIGKQYRSEVFYHDEQQQEAARAYMEKLSQSGKYDEPIVTKLSALEKFYEAEDYHQNYYEHNPDNPYIINVARPKIEKFKKNYSSMLKEGIS
ncbi:peptide-methionine (S)-S-oxide reductase MsrA [Catalinimonas sp. 4WD22]|uniref:peptide-methionine (S)-S-oxide reductase MsrA n=1 Tax=Catalinimonas locisalis TaxID=3133978 RepID=UPI00310150ED